jgi:uncharacterized protein (TIRG00374 family)
MPKLPSNITKPLRVLAGAAISAGLIWVFLKDVQLGEVANSLKMADPIFVIPMIGIFFLRYWLRALRWSVLVQHLRKIRPRLALPRVIFAQASNIMLPFQLGYVVMVQISSRKFQLGRRELFGAEIIERIMDGFVFSLMLALALATLAIGNGFTGLTIFMLFGTTTGLCLVWFFTRPQILKKKPGTGLSKHLFRFLQSDTITPLIHGLKAAQQKKQMFKIFLLTSFAWMAEALLYWLVAESLGIDASPLVHIFVVAAANIGAGIPLAQSGIGLILLANLSLRGIGETAETAVAYAIGVEAIVVLPLLFLAPFAAWDMRLSWKDFDFRNTRVSKEKA